MRVDLSELLPIRRGDNLILDTDMSSDCDDAGALSLLIDGCRKTGASLRAVINDTDNLYANGAIDAILNYYGADAQIGQTSDKGFETEKIPINIKYNRYLSEHFSKRFRNGNLHIPSSRVVYEKVLSEADDQSVVLITVGFLNTAAEALRLFPSLFAKKVRCVVSMAGNFKTPSDPEWNILRNSAVAKFFFENCPVPIVFDGFELGYSFRTGFAAFDSENPVSVAYELHGKVEGASYDLCAVDMAVCGFGEDSDWKLSEPFSLNVLEDGSLRLCYDNGALCRFASFSD